MENKIPTAEEFLIKISNEHSYETWGECMYDTHEHTQIEYTKEAMIEFAKFHVEQALKLASEQKTYGMMVVPLFNEEQQKSILNSYPLTNVI